MPHLKRNDFDPLAYIESAFLDTKSKEEEAKEGDLTIPNFLWNKPSSNGAALKEREETEESRVKFKRTTMSAPRPRRARQTPEPVPIDPDLQAVWEVLPKNIDFLCSFFDDSVTANYYRGEFKESRQELVRRLLDPELTLEETSRLLGVCPATVRRYTNRAWLKHHRTQGGQRRFRLSDIVRFVNEHGRFPEE